MNIIIREYLIFASLSIYFSESKWQEKSQDACRTSTDSIRCLCAILLCISWQEKSQDYGPQTKILECRSNIRERIWQTPKSPIIRCSYGQETSFEGMYDKSGFGDFGDWYLDGRTNPSERIFDALFTYVSTRFGLRSFEKCFENTFPNV